MELLFEIDEGGYKPEMELYERFAARAVIVDGEGKIAMQRDRRGEYKLPGGGIEPGEDVLQALYREVREETGMTVLPETVREIGEVIERRVDRFSPDKRYVAHSYCYLCSCAREVGETDLTEDEQAHGYRLVWAEYDDIIAANTSYPWSVRDTSLLTLLRKRGVI